MVDPTYGVPLPLAQPLELDRPVSPLAECASPRRRRRWNAGVVSARVGRTVFAVAYRALSTAGGLAMIPLTLHVLLVAAGARATPFVEMVEWCARPLLAPFAGMLDPQWLGEARLDMDALAAMVVYGACLSFMGRSLLGWVRRFDDLEARYRARAKTPAAAATYSDVKTNG